MSELPKTFDPAAIEERWYAHWESRGLFRPDRPDAEPWTIVMPPPNVTGSLHIGHALDNHAPGRAHPARADARQGCACGWSAPTMPGSRRRWWSSATSSSQELSAPNCAREAFLEHVWEWKEQIGRRDHPPAPPSRRIAATGRTSASRWTRAFQRAVTKVFVELHKRGLLYRDKRLVNWDPKFQTAISDLEVENRDVQGHMWHFKYPLAAVRPTPTSSGRREIVEESAITSRSPPRGPRRCSPTCAVAVHPDDERYKALVGKLCEHPDRTGARADPDHRRRTCRSRTSARAR